MAAYFGHSDCDSGSIASCPTGESASKRHTRLPPLREATWLKLMKAAIVARSGSEETLLPGDLFIYFDNGKNVDGTMFKPFLAQVDNQRAQRAIGTKKTYFLMYDESSLRARQRCNYTPGSLQQVENMYVVTSSDLSLNERKRLHYPGTNMGNVLGPIVFPLYSSMWQTDYKTKKLILGSKIFKVGGPGGGDSKEECEKRTDDTVEPVFLHAFPESLEEEIMHSFCVKAGVLDLFAGEGTMAMTALRAGVLGFHELGATSRIRTQFLGPSGEASQHEINMTLDLCGVC